MNRFDWHTWKASFYKGPEELEGALNTLGVKGKIIKEVHTIGMADNMQPFSYIQTIRQILFGMGVSYEDIDSGKYPEIGSTLIPCEVEICEPVVLVFEDESTFEMMPKDADGLLLSVNQIPADVVNGTNNQNYDSSLFFNRMIGASINHIQIIKGKIFGQNRTYPERIQSSILFQFRLSGEFGFYIRQSHGRWYIFGLTLQNDSTELGNLTVNISFAEVKQAANNIRQVQIAEGHDGGSCFWIMPVKHAKKTKENWIGIDEYRLEEISIEEDDVRQFLYYFLDKYYDHDYPYGDSRDEFSSNDFEWNLEYNIYTYKSINLMLRDMEHCCKLLETDYDHKELTELKRYFCYYSFEADEERRDKKLTNQEKERIIRSNINIATDFYHRFITRINAMMVNAPGYDLISFMGP